MNFCDCMITEHINGPPTCNRCLLEISSCECTNLSHSLFCPDRPKRKKVDKELRKVS